MKKEDSDGEDDGSTGFTISIKKEDSDDEEGRGTATIVFPVTSAIPAAAGG